MYLCAGRAGMLRCGSRLQVGTNNNAARKGSWHGTTATAMKPVAGNYSNGMSQVSMEQACRIGQDKHETLHLHGMCSPRVIGAQANAIPTSLDCLEGLRVERASLRHLQLRTEDVVRQVVVRCGCGCESACVSAARRCARRTCARMQPRISPCTSCRCDCRAQSACHGLRRALGEFPRQACHCA